MTAGKHPAIITYVAEPSTLGRVFIASGDKGLVALFLGDADAELIADLSRRFPNSALEPGDKSLRAIAKRIVTFVESPTEDCEVAIDPIGTEFQRSVWRALRKIPLGSTTTYARVAEKIGRAATSSRAVATACGANPISILIPCHRVVASNGNLSGYRWGIERKRKLLEREGATVGRR